MITTIIILSIIVVALGFTTINLLRKNEKQEDILLGYLKYLDNDFAKQDVAASARLKI